MAASVFISYYAIIALEGPAIKTTQRYFTNLRTNKTKKLLWYVTFLIIFIHNINFIMNLLQKYSPRNNKNLNKHAINLPFPTEI